MTTAEQKLRQINDEGHWVAPNLSALGFAIDGLSRSITKLRDAEGWEGKSADAADILFEQLVTMYRTASIAIEAVSDAIAKANEILTNAMNDVEHLPGALISPEAYAAIENARSSGKPTVQIPGFGSSFLIEDALHSIATLLGGHRDAAARSALAILQAKLDAVSTSLEGPRADLTKVAKWTFDPDGDGTSSTDIPMPTGWPLPPRPTPIRTLTPAPPPPPAPPVPRALPELPHPWVPVPRDPGIVTPPPYLIGIGDPSVPEFPDPSADDGSEGTVPGGGGGRGAGFGGGGGSHSGLAAGVLGGATLTGAAALRMGVGGFGGGGMGAGGAGGPGSVGAGAGGGMMGGQPMGGGGSGSRSDKKEKRPGLGGLMAPKLEDEAEFIPLPDGARAGGRSTAPRDDL